jgi:hypothetical protein
MIGLDGNQKGYFKPRRLKRGFISTQMETLLMSRDMIGSEHSPKDWQKLKRTVSASISVQMELLPMSKRYCGIGKFSEGLADAEDEHDLFQIRPDGTRAD